MRTRSAFVTILPALLAVVCMQSSNTEAQVDPEAQLSAAINAAAPLGIQLSQGTTEAQEAETLAYWTPERLANAQPMLPLVDQKAVTESEAAPQGNGTSVSLPAKRPTATASVDGAIRLYDPAQVRTQSEAGGVETQAVGTSGLHYTAARVQPVPETVFPWRTVGKLFFTENPTGISKVCSASMVRPRVLLTAGHCVHRGSGGTAGFHRNFLFVPAFRNGVALLGVRATARFVATTTQWQTSNGLVPNAADFGMMELNDRAGVKIGSITGSLGIKTLSLIPNNTTKLGYPCNIDACQLMQQVWSQSGRFVLPNNVEAGSNNRGGSSGGPWAMNFGIQGSGGATTFPNTVVGVSSYGNSSLLPQYVGSSIPDSRPGGFIPLLNLVCAQRAGNC